MILLLGPFKHRIIPWSLKISLVIFSTLSYAYSNIIKLLKLQLVLPTSSPLLTNPVAPLVSHTTQIVPHRTPVRVVIIGAEVVVMGLLVVIAQCARSVAKLDISPSSAFIVLIRLIKTCRTTCLHFLQCHKPQLI